MNPNLDNGQNSNANKSQSPIRIPDFSKKAFSPLTEEQKYINPKQMKQVKKVDYSFRAIIFLILSVFMMGGVFFVYNFALNFMETKELAQEKKFVFENPLVRGDKSRVISLEAGANKESVRSILIQALKNERVAQGELSVITPSYLRDTVINNERKLVSEPQRGDDFVFTFLLRSPINLKTLAGEKYALGTAGVGDVKSDGSKNFLAFSVSNAPDANREMLRYESQLYYDMKEVLNLRELKGDFYFKDLGVDNHILRVGYDDEGVVMVYGFAAPKTVLIAPNSDTFSFVFTKLK